MINKFARKQEVVEAARRANVYDKLCEGIEKLYGWYEEDDPEFTGDHAMSDMAFPFISYNASSGEINGTTKSDYFPDAEQVTGGYMLDLILKKSGLLGIEDVFVDADSLSVEDVVKLLVDFKSATGKSFWQPEDAARLKKVDPDLEKMPQYKGKQFRKVIFFDRQAGLDAVHIEVGDLPRPHSAATGERHLVEVTAQEFQKLYSTKLFVPTSIVEEEEQFVAEDTEFEYLPNTGVMPSEDFVQVRFNNGKTEVAKGTVFNWSVDNNHDLEEWAIKEYFILPRTAKYNYHNGGHRPCGGHVKVLFRDGTTDSGSATHFTWGHHEQDRDIVGWLPTNNPKPRYRKRRQKPPVGKKSVVRVLYTTQQTYTFKNVVDVQVTEERVYIQYDREVTEGIKESVTTEIENKLVMAIIVEESKVENGKAYTVRDSFLRNIDGTWDYNGHDGTAVKNGKIMGRQFLSKR